MQRFVQATLEKFNSNLICKICSDFQTKEENMKAYLKSNRKLMTKFNKVKVEQVWWTKNSKANNLAKMA